MPKHSKDNQGNLRNKPCAKNIICCVGYSANQLLGAKWRDMDSAGTKQQRRMSGALTVFLTG
jgi:hypothetical protein